MPANDTLNVVTQRRRQGTPGEVLAAFLKLGLTSFGGPIAHLGYFREDFVAGAAGSTIVPMPIWSRCASSFPGQHPARSASLWACSVPGRRVRWPLGLVLPCLPPCC